jgi:hemerythrin-like domain-containing protein
MTSATSELRDDHEAILRIADMLEAAARRNDIDSARGLSDLRRLEQVLAALIGDHEFREEALLFPALMGSGVPMVFGVMGRLIAEHGRRRMDRQRIASDLAGGATGRMQAEIGAYADSVRRHIELEERECFDVADDWLLPAVREALAQEFAVRRTH